MEYLAAENTLYIKTKGVLTSESANKMVKEAVQVMGLHQCSKQIVDHRETTFAFNLLEYYERPTINEQIGISHLWKIAMIFKELNEQTYFMETVFRNRGFDFRQFEDIKEAKEWLAKL
ncbi:MAG: hypothetical protein H7Y59_17145 [Anaerolineales bacterium]|nr:hypothetical protein [Anaerolineales bacterium]